MVACSNIFIECYYTYDQHNYDMILWNSFEIDDGTRVVENGEQKQVTAEDAGTVSRGQYTFVVDGQRFTVNWIADENGFQPSGDHLPTPPPTPDHVVKLLEDLRLAGQL